MHNFTLPKGRCIKAKERHSLWFIFKFSLKDAASVNFLKDFESDFEFCAANTENHF